MTAQPDAARRTGADSRDAGRRHQWLASAGRRCAPRAGATGLALAGFVVAVAVIGPLRGPAHPPAALLTFPFGKPSGQFPLGADFLGRDVLSRVLDGGWLLLLMAVSATVLGIAAGAAAGISAAYLRGRSDGLIMRTVDVILAFPQLVFALLLLSILGPRLWLIVLAVGPDPRARRGPGAAVRDPGHLRAGLRQGGRAAGDAPGRGDDQGDPAQPEHPADGGGGTAADLLDHHHGGPGLPGLRPAAAVPQLGDHDQREPGRAGPEPVGRDRPRRC